ncbi:hypothetical protein E2C01_041963 [Portunus trituberculatus]|uniref:Uncharacterized protein n=1 Tax=Portunus trituberculatus TaxID=210409 RepID=A0A5B7FS34_PORTR|nr:hypothetical protein [Portunus trituberculatus]
MYCQLMRSGWLCFTLPPPPLLPPLPSPPPVPSSSGSPSGARVQATINIWQEKFSSLTSRCVIVPRCWSWWCWWYDGREGKVVVCGAGEGVIVVAVVWQREGKGCAVGWKAVVKKGYGMMVVMVVWGDDRIPIQCSPGVKR